MALVVVTWNVLHRIHAVNWDEPAIRAWPDEAARVAAIAAAVAALPADVVCLQEVSGDQVDAVRAVERGAVFATPHARVPGYYRRFEPPALRDPREHLVTIVRAPGARLTAAETFPEDPGKGCHVVELADGALVITTHVSHGDHHAAQCARLAARAAGAASAVVAGDFNEDRATCAARLGPGLVTAAPPPGARRTRPRPDNAAKAQDIDHVFVAGRGIAEVEVLDAAGRSDHHPVRARLV